MDGMLSDRGTQATGRARRRVRGYHRATFAPLPPPMNFPFPCSTAPRRVSRAWLPLAAVVLVAAAAAFPALAQAPAGHVLRIVVGAGPGAGADIPARLLAHGLEAELGEPMIVDNRPGGEGFIAARQVASAPSDGRTLLFAFGSQFAINPAIFASLPYDPQRDFAPIMLLARQPALLAVHPSLPVTTLRELVDYTRANPKTVNYGAGTSTFMLIAESLKLRTGADMQHIPFSGASQVLTALLAGTVQVAVLPAQGSIASAQAGRIRVLAVSGDTRLRQLPGVPTLSESGPGDEVPVWTALFAPAGTPPRAIDAIRAAALRVLAQPAVHERWTADADVIVGSTPEELAATVVRDTERMKSLVKAIGLPLR